MFLRLRKRLSFRTPHGGDAPLAAAFADAPLARRIHEGLFGDSSTLVRALPGVDPADWQQLLFGPAVDPAAVWALADDPAQPSRVRALAYGWLRARRLPVPRGVLLGLVAEWATADGVEALAAYADGRLRLVHPSGRLLLADAPLPAQAAGVGAWLAAGAAALDRATPWQRPPGALPPPGEVRLAWVCADGLRRCAGRPETLARDAALGPVLQAADRLRQALEALAR